MASPRVDVSKERAKVLEVPRSGDLARQIQHTVDGVTAVVPEDVVVPPEIAT